MSKVNGKSVSRGVSGARGEDAGQAGQVSKGNKPVSSYARGSGDFVFDMRALGRGPGEVKDERRTASAAVAPLTGECARCLDPLTSTIEVSFQELYRYLPDPDESEDDGEERFLDGDFLDLEPAFRDAVVLALPLSPLCRDDCPGLCAECGAKLADVGPDHGHGDKVDPRWGLLAKLELNDTTE